MYITELVPGQKIAAWLQLGRSLKKGRHLDGTPFRYLPLKPGPAGQDDLPKFLGQVIRNDPQTLTITLNVMRMGKNLDVVDSECLEAVIPYPLIQRLRLFSEISYSPNPKSTTWPTKLLTNVPYRTLTEVTLKW